MANRLERVAEDVKREIGRIIQNELKDPRLPPMVSVLKADISSDYRYAKVYVSVMGGEEEKTKALQALESAAGFIRREIGRRIKIRSVPELHFKLDDSIEHSIYISKLISDTVRKNDGAGDKEPDR